MSTEKVEPSQYWTVLPSSNDWACNVIDPEGYYSAYIKGDGCVHIWRYATQKEDMTKPSPTRTWYGKDQFID